MAEVAVNQSPPLTTTESFTDVYEEYVAKSQAHSQLKKLYEAEIEKAEYEKLFQLKAAVKAASTEKNNALFELNMPKMWPGDASNNRVRLETGRILTRKPRSIPFNKKMLSDDKYLGFSLGEEIAEKLLKHAENGYCYSERDDESLKPPPKKKVKIVTDV